MPNPERSPLVTTSRFWVDGEHRELSFFFFYCVAERAVKPCRSSRSNTRGRMIKSHDTCKTGSKHQNSNTENLASGSITITDTEDRRRELVDAMTAVLRAESLRLKEAEQLRWRMVFFGSITNVAVKSLDRLA